MVEFIYETPKNMRKYFPMLHTPAFLVHSSGKVYLKVGEPSDFVGHLKHFVASDEISDENEKLRYLFDSYQSLQNEKLFERYIEWRKNNFAHGRQEIRHLNEFELIKRALKRNFFNQSFKGLFDLPNDLQEGLRKQGVDYLNSIEDTFDYKIKLFLSI